jgi:hypothetical protein
MAERVKGVLWQARIPRRSSGLLTVLLTLGAGLAAYKAFSAPTRGWGVFFFTIAACFALMIVATGLLSWGDSEDLGTVRGCKLARLVQLGGEIHLAPATGRGTYDVEDRAACIAPVRSAQVRFPIAEPDLIALAMSLHRRRHEAPEDGCSCGFHAGAGDHRTPLPGEVVVDVELSGRRIATDDGYRAAHQKVLAVHVPRGCAIERAGGASETNRCGRRARGVVVLSNGAWPMCDDHGLDLTVPLERIAQRLGTEVDWLE